MAEGRSFLFTEFLQTLREFETESDNYHNLSASECEILKLCGAALHDLGIRKKLADSVLRDDSIDFANHLKTCMEVISEEDEGEENSNIDARNISEAGFMSQLLRLCCSFDSINCSTVLINRGLEAATLIEGVGENGWSALHTAADAHAKQCIDLLLRKRARTDAKSRNNIGRLPLELALYSRKMAVAWTPDDTIDDLLLCLDLKDLTAIKLLTEKTNETAQVAFACAIQCEVVALAALLLVASSKINIQVSKPVPYSDTSLTIYESVIREALSLDSPGIPNLESINSTFKMIERDKQKKKEILLRELELLQHFGAIARTVCAGNGKALSPLIHSCKAGDERVTELLLRTNIDVNDTDAEGNSSLHWCLKTKKEASAQQTRILEVLLKNGAQVSLKNQLGLTAVHLAAAIGNKNAIQLLLSEDPESVEATTVILETPLFFAAKNDFVDCAKILLQFGANTEVLNLRKQRPIELAKSQDMRFILSPTKIILTSRISRESYQTRFHNNQSVGKTWKVFMPETHAQDTRISSTLKDTWNDQNEPEKGYKEAAEISRQTGKRRQVYQTQDANMVEQMEKSFLTSTYPGPCNDRHRASGDVPGNDYANEDSAKLSPQHLNQKFDIQTTSKPFEERPIKDTRLHLQNGWLCIHCVSPSDHSDDQPTWSYRACMEEAKCFACKEGEMLWANFPCYHSLWCSNCKALAIRAASSSEHKCVVCDAKISGIIWKPLATYKKEYLHLENAKPEWATTALLRQHH